MEQITLIKKTELNNEIWYVVKGEKIDTAYFRKYEDAKKSFDTIKENLEKYGGDRIEVIEKYPNNNE